MEKCGDSSAAAAGWKGAPAAAASKGKPVAAAGAKAKGKPVTAAGVKGKGKLSAAAGLKGKDEPAAAASVSSQFNETLEYWESWSLRDSQPATVPSIVTRPCQYRDVRLNDPAPPTRAALAIAAVGRAAAAECGIKQVHFAEDHCTKLQYDGHCSVDFRNQAPHGST